MKLTPNDCRILVALAEYYALSAAMIHRLCFAHRKDARHTRRRLAELAKRGYVRKSPVNVAFSSGNAGPVYTPTVRGCEQLEIHFDDPVWLATFTKAPRRDRLHHWLDISWTHSVIRRASAACDDVKLVQWINEWQPTRDADGNAGGYVLHTQFRESPPLSCSPDAAFLLDIGGHRRVFYVEVDRGTSGAKRVAASKMPGYDELLLTRRHREHFPTTTFDDFAVVLVTVDNGHRNAILREIGKRQDLHPALWLVTTKDQFTPDSALSGSIFTDHTGETGPLIGQPTPAKAEVSDVV